MKTLAAFLLAALAAPAFQEKVRVNARDAGAKGDGVSDDSAAIQAMIDKAPDNACFYFPAGTYRLHSLKVTKRSKLEFVGDGHASILQWSGAGLPNSYTRMILFTEVTDLLIHKLAFDNKAINNYGGVNFYSMKNVRIENTRFFDSARREKITNDRYAYCFGQGGTPSENITFTDNLIQDLEVEIDHARRVRVLRNTFERGVWLCFNWSSHGPNSVLEDYEVSDNTFSEPAGYAMTFHSEHEGPHRISGLRIANNTIRMHSYKRFGINVGNSQNQKDKGTVWENITVENNRIEYTQGYKIDQWQGIRVARTPGDGPMTNVAIRNNTVVGNGSLQTWAITANCLKNSTVSGNTVTGALHGISLTDDLQGNTVSQNSVQATDTAYRFERSLGGNKVTGNAVAGTPKTRWARSAVHATDSLEAAEPK